MNLDPDLLRIFNVGAKVYDTQNKRQGKVFTNNEIDIIVDYGKGKYETYKIDQFSDLLTSDVIVANSRVTLGNGENFKIKPREKSESDFTIGHWSGSEPSVQNLPRPAPESPKYHSPLETGYINFTTNKFSTEPKKGYTKVEYKKSTERVTLELTSEQLEKLKEMGLM